MNAELRKFTTQIARDIIALSQLLDSELETWTDVVARVPDSTSKNVSAGFITKPSATSGIELVVDVQAPPSEHTARLRIWAIEIVKDNDGNERFNNIQLTYQLDYATARQIVEDTITPTRTDLVALLDNPAVQLQHIIVSDQTGKHNTTHQTLGKRYDLDSHELSNISESLCNELQQALNTVLARLKQSAASATNNNSGF